MTSPLDALITEHVDSISVNSRAIKYTIYESAKKSARRLRSR